MSNFEKVVPQHVRALGGYVPGKPIKDAERESGVRCIKMASNENPFGPSPLAVEAMRRAAEDANLYPDNEVTSLRQRLAKLHGVGTENILVTAGSTSFLTIIGRTLLAPGLNAVTSERSFIIYPIATEAPGGRLITVAMRGDTFDLDRILAAINPETRIVFIANPNNPTGTLLAPPELDRFMSQVPEQVCVVLDEAYCDFAQYFARQRGVEYSHSMQYVREGRNIVVLRTFSKAHGLAGARIGYGIAPAEQISYFARMRTVFSVTHVAEAAALAAIEDEQHIRKTLENNAAGIEYLSKPDRRDGIARGPDVGELPLRRGGRRRGRAGKAHAGRRRHHPSADRQMGCAAGHPHHRGNAGTEPPMRGDPEKSDGQGRRCQPLRSFTPLISA